MIAEGKEIEIHPIKVLFDTLETSEVRLSRKPKMDLSHLKEPVDEGDDGAAEEPVTADSEEAVPVS